MGSRPSDVRFFEQKVKRLGAVEIEARYLHAVKHIHLGSKLEGMTKRP
jgi:hypothetical protein